MGVRGQLSVPSVVLGAEMAGASLYGSFRTGLEFGSGNAKVVDVGSRWGIKGSHEVSEGLTASYKYEGRINTTNAESFGGVGHAHAAVDESVLVKSSSDEVTATNVAANEAEGTLAYSTHACVRGDAYLIEIDADDPDVVTYVDIGTSATDMSADDNATCGTLISHAHDAVTGDGTAGGRLSYISLSGGFGTVSLGQIWSASANHYGFAVDPSYAWGSFGGASYRPGNTVSYSSSAGDVSFQIDKVTGDSEKIEFGASANLGPVGVGLGYWDNANDEKTFTGIAISAGAAGVNLTIGLGSTDYVDTENGKGKADTSILHVGGSLGDSGVSYAVQVTNTDEVYGPMHKHAGKDKSQNVIVLTNSLGSGASIIFEHLDPADLDSSSLIGLKVDF